MMKKYMNEPIDMVHETEKLKNTISALQDEVKELTQKIEYYEKMDADLCELTGETIETFLMRKQ